jgi:hypothetical protein
MHSKSSLEEFNIFKDLTFSCATSDFTDRDFPSENDMILATPVSKSAAKNHVRGVLARVKSVSSKGGELKVVLAMHLVNRSEIRNCLRPSLSWSFKKICSLTTIVREYEALSKMKDFALYREICKPVRIVAPTIDRSKLEETMKCFKVNQPQAAAILASTSRSKGFILIQGPPGTGKTRTLLAIIGANIQKATPVLTPGNVNSSNVIMRKNKLLCCAPSNAAVDEIGRRLLDGIIDRRGRVFKPKVVRIGTAAMHSDVNEISLVCLMILLSEYSKI